MASTILKFIYFMRPERAKQGLNHVADDDDDDDDDIFIFWLFDSLLEETQKDIRKRLEIFLSDGRRMWYFKLSSKLHSKEINALRRNIQLNALEGMVNGEKKISVEEETFQKIIYLYKRRGFCKLLVEAILQKLGYQLQCCSTTTLDGTVDEKGDMSEEEIFYYKFNQVSWRLASKLSTASSAIFFRDEEDGRASRRKLGS
ncbi:hypothetical protein ANN_08103 [Periplaneta americana]|uniref:Uncharacterized protein n=1 Tax=Periplaneta americana TaxID=6978 RepID=A0ABQ8T213_PERAM|nr:hypothetical protein ANN_08103 [Periplaneta americana]